MKRKIIAMVLIVVLGIINFSNIKSEVQAEDLGEDIEFSSLLTEDTLVGSAEMQTWGVYLVTGNSYINKIATGKIGAGGDTVAATACKVSVTSIVERLDGGLWARVTSWTSTTPRGYAATVSKSLVVGTGYYYRVRSSHYASTDASSSWTSALWMGN